ncbi:indolethylamine N-methyltransferase-like isoform X2 [Ptychodera flava]|uniref:indolethylamine N-methyltransferase-like isoform X2 n=1 Tax=Ptychodera flava TaxID=63121 RepID=UPI003969D687
MATVYRGDAYNTDFESTTYLKTCVFSDLEAVQKANAFRSDMFEKTFSKCDFTGPRLLEIGGGPNIANAIHACTRFPEIIFSDYSEKCRQAVEKWVKNTPDAVDWSQFIKSVCDKEGNENKWEERQAMVRQSIREIIHCDLLKSNPLEPKVYEPFDAIVTSYCVEAACPDKDSFKEAIKNIVNLLKPGGVLFIFTVLNESFYVVGEKRFYCLKVEETFVKTAVVEAGCHIVSAEFHSLDTHLGDLSGMSFLAAIKQ